jgi:hypothetical protein
MGGWWRCSSPHLNPPPPGGRRIADAAGQETCESDRALILEFQYRILCPLDIFLFRVADGPDLIDLDMFAGKI